MNNKIELYPVKLLGITPAEVVSIEPKMTFVELENPDDPSNRLKPWTHLVVTITLTDEGMKKLQEHKNDSPILYGIGVGK